VTLIVVIVYPIVLVTIDLRIVRFPWGFGAYMAYSEGIQGAANRQGIDIGDQFRDSLFSLLCFLYSSY
jgi:hypothetical protein